MNPSKNKTMHPADPLTMDLFADQSVGAGGAPPPPAGPSIPASEGDFIDMGAFAERSYLTYAMSVVRGRAIPNIEDGQKPVQRRIRRTLQSEQFSGPFLKETCRPGFVKITLFVDWHLGDL